MTPRLSTLGLLLILAATAPAATPTSSARGVVFHDLNGNQTRDPGEPGLPGVLVSNQRQVVPTDAAGHWQLPASDDCIFFVVKPSGWQTPLNHQNLPQFYTIHKPNGSPRVRFRGVEPTGPLPPFIDFPLTPQAEPETFRAVVFADPQPRDQREVDYIAHDVIEELIGVDAAFGMTLGDIMFDNLRLFPDYNALVALIGIPWYNVIGNHDINYDTPNDRYSDETFERHYGPSYYAFDYGPVTFVVLDDIEWGGAKPEGTGKYVGGLGEDQLTFLRQLLPQIPTGRLLVFLMHIPLPGVRDREELFRLIEDRPYTLSISGHTHWQAHFFLDEEDGWRGAKPHHHMVNVTVSGSWWSGEPDELGIPHTMMVDGAPNGYSLITFDGQKAVIDFKAARRPADHQLHVQAPEVILYGDTNLHPVYVNVFGGSERSTVRMRIGELPSWIELSRVLEADPYFLKLKSFEAEAKELHGRPLPKPSASRHLWKAPLPTDLSPGTYRIRVETEDQYGRIFHGSRTLRVE